MGKMLTNEDFLQNLVDKNVKDVPIDKYNGSSTRIHWMCHNNSNHIYDATPDELYKSKSCCPYCYHRKVFVGETDMWTTNPEMARMLYNEDDGYKYFATSSKKVDWICPCCKSIIKNKIINNVRMYGLSCPNCSDGMSFAEKFANAFLRQVCSDIVHDKTTEWSGQKRYDFYIPSMSLIVETHGIQHYEDSFERYNTYRTRRTLCDEIENDIEKRNLAELNGIKYYVEIDCRKSDCDYIKNSIFDSDLSTLFDLSSVNWDECYKATLTSNVLFCAELWNNGMKSTFDISNYTGIHISSVINYLKRAAKIGLCDFIVNYKKNKNRYKKVLCVETQKVYECINRVKDDGFCNSHISNCCNGKIETAYGMHWKFL